MARTIAQIKQSIVDAKNADSNLSGLTSTSNVADWNLWAYIVAVAQWTLEKLFDAHVAEVQNILATQKPHTLQWYVTMAKAFQYGADLPADTDAYDNTGLTADQITEMQIVNFASATETGSGLRIKAANLVSGQLQQLASAQITAFATYMGIIKDAGVRLTITSGPADRFVTAMTVYYDPLILNGSGQRLDGTDNIPVQDAISSFLNSLPFNGVFILNNYITALQLVDGVVIADVQSVQATYGSLALTEITTQYLPDAGYLAIDITNDLNISFIPYADI